MAVLDFRRPHRWLGPEDDEGQLWVLQDGEIMSWSESNTRYETAWWLNADGTVNEQCGAKPDHLANIVRDRPFDPSWL